MNRRIIILIFAALLLASQKFNAQKYVPLGKVEVFALRGKISFDGKLLHKSDIFEFKPGINPANQLDFGSSLDWIKVIDQNTKKIFSFYKQKKYACSNCLGTRGKEGVPKTLTDYFRQKSIFLFEPDTLIIKHFDKSGQQIRVICKVFADGHMYECNIRNYDTLFIAKDRLFGYAKELQIQWPSFRTDSIRLVYRGMNGDKDSIPPFPVFNVVFFEDAVQYLRHLGLETEEICNELIVNFAELKTIAVSNNFVSDEEAKQWLFKKIQEMIIDEL